MSNVKTVLNTGASSGIGLATSRQLAAGGARLWSISESLTGAGERLALEAIR